MGFLNGGTADKLGNRYEGRWVVKQLLSLIAERVRSVQLEGIGDDEVGVDLWVEHLDGVRVAHQCKAFNKSNSKWSIADLKERKVLEKASEQLARDSSVEFKFVSTIVAAELEDLSRNARDTHCDAATFFKDFVEGKPRAKPFKAFCRALNLDPTKADDRASAFDLLKRIQSHCFVDDREARLELEFLVSSILEGGTPTAAIAALAEIATDNILRKLTAPEVVRLLEPYGLRLRSRGSDQLTVARLETLRQDFMASIKPHLAAGQLIKRPETQELLHVLGNAERPDAIVLHGAPGFGKSGILYELAETLREAGVIVFAIRLDRQSPKTLSAAEYGRELGLPISPVACLRDIAAGQPAVLILDQLDALRWTSAHASQGLAICKEMLREVQAARSIGAKIDVVIACRTFDLERDQEIRAWLSNDKSHLRVAKAEAKSLPPEAVRQVAKDAGGIEPDSLRPTQLRLLESILHLTIWLEIVLAERTSPQFDSSTQLMRLFWNNRRQKLEVAGCDPQRRDATIAALVGYMEDHACLSAPERLLGNDNKLKTELQSWGVIRILGHEVSFGHQSNLDFLIADSAVHRMALEHITILQWLGAKDRQSLFRREQLRQVLFLLADEDHDRFLATVTLLLECTDSTKPLRHFDRMALGARNAWRCVVIWFRRMLKLNTPGVRFHLRQLTLETLGQVLPKPATLDLVLRLLEQPQWTEHVRFHVISGNKAYVTALYERGLLLNWLASTDKIVWQRAADWIWSVRKSAPELVVTVCQRVIEYSNDWIERVSWMIGRDGAEDEPNDLYLLRLKCLKRGSKSQYVGWPEFTKKHPIRSIHLYHALLLGWIARGATRDRHQHGDESHIYGQESAGLLVVARSFPGLTWKLFWPRFQWLIREQPKRRRAWLREHTDETYWPRDERLAIPQTLYATLVIAGRRIARHHPEKILMLAKAPLVRRSRRLTAFLVEILGSLPIHHADTVIHWLLSDLHRLHCGPGVKRPRWSPATRLIRRMSPHCTDTTFSQLERALLDFRDPDEMRSVKFWLSYTKHGQFANKFGAAQFHLLPALCVNRRSTEATGRLGVVQTKFANWANESFISRPKIQGGFVSSSIDSNRQYTRMSDKAWLKLISNKELPTRDGRWRSRHGRRSGVIESSVEMMSRSFGRAARLDPERFARLGLQFPADAHPNYVSELFRALQQTKPPNEVPEDKQADWTPATPDSLERLLHKVPLINDSEQASAFCWIVAERTDLRITEPILERIVRCAEHSDPESDQLHVDCDKRASECSADTLETNAINSVRGVAALAIASVLWQRIDLLPQLRSVIEKLLADPHPAVRVAAVRVCGPVWNKDRQLAVQWLAVAAKNDSRIAACHESVQFYNYGFPQYADQLIPVVRRMVNSPIAKVAEAGARQVAARWLFNGLFKREFAQCLRGTTSQRSGVVHTIAQLATDTEYTKKCLRLVQRFLNDEQKDVRHELHWILNHARLFEFPWAPGFLVKVVRSKAGHDDDHWLFWKLKEHPGSLEPFAEVLFTFSDVISSEFAKPQTNENHRFPDVDGLIHLLLRLYERASGPNKQAIRQRCLDAWDILLQSRAAVAWALTCGLDETKG